VPTSVFKTDELCASSGLEGSIPLRFPHLDVYRGGLASPGPSVGPPRTESADLAADDASRESHGQAAPNGLDSRWREPARDDLLELGRRRGLRAVRSAMSAASIPRSTLVGRRCGGRGQRATSFLTRAAELPLHARRESTSERL